MARMGRQQPMPAGGGPAQEDKPPQLGDRGGLVGMGSSPWNRGPHHHCPAGHVDRNGRRDGVAAHGGALDDACSGGCPPMGNRQASAVA